MPSSGAPEPCRPVERLPLTRSRTRSALALAGGLWFGGGFGLLGAPTGVTVLIIDRDASGLLMALVMTAVAVPLVPMGVQTVRASFLRPRAWLEPDAIVIRDPVLFHRHERVARADVAGARVLEWRHDGPRADHAVAELSPFRERLTLEIRLRREVPFESARPRWTGNWVWHLGRPWETRPLLPERGRRYSRLWLRTRDPEIAAEVIAAWAAGRDTRRAGSL
jgi:hypothetical protein